MLALFALLSLFHSLLVFCCLGVVCLSVCLSSLELNSASILQAVRYVVANNMSKKRKGPNVKQSRIKKKPMFHLKWDLRMNLISVLKNPT